MTSKYYEITEQPGQKATKEQLERLYQRYHFASLFISGGSVLEVACGSGLGLGYLANYAERVVGGDIDKRNIEMAKRHYQNRENIAVLEMDAHHLPPGDECCDTIVLFEAVYYLNDPGRFVSEANRLLKPGGNLIVSTVNKEWKGFHPSKYAVRYFSVEELKRLLMPISSEIRLFGGFEDADTGMRGRALTLLKNTASHLHLIPGSLKARAYLKRVFVGSLEPLPTEVRDGMVEYASPEPIDDNSSSNEYKILYAVLQK